MAFIAQRIARRGCSQSHRSSDIARINLFDLLPFVGVHLEESADSFSFALGRIIDARTGSQRTGIDPKKAQCPDERVGHDLESEGRKGRIIFYGTHFHRLRVWIDTFNWGYIQRRRQIVHHGIEERLNPLVSESRATQNWDDLDGKGSVANSSAQLTLADLFSFEVFLHDALVTIGRGLQELVVVLPGLRDHALRNRFDPEFGS